MSRVLSTTAPLCLACSSSLPPRLWKRTHEGAQSGSTSPGSSSAVFLTRCCGRPICPSCLALNPRLARYDPCLACLGGVGAVSEKVRGQYQAASFNVNVDGAIRDEDVFVVGDEDEDESAEIHVGESTKTPGATEPPSEVAKHAQHDISGGQARASPTTPGETPEGNQGSPGRYYIQPDDTLLGISLRLGVEGRTLCKLNDLPPSTLRTTPHLLHTRTFLVLPQSHP
ncbi:hypothetical protein F5148DRAFT_1168202 [Russula earlei]|uniref:Uncharacterized protein n=1 Tax=Russula earlei TaxID=71964 RepID=A0ACC0UJG6_9AGAM|nr:hypothetical protein F5148DRAFT_1168202 [Russula earlei]